MAEWIDNWKKTVALFTEQVEAVESERWGDSTPGEDWDVRTLVTHAVDSQRGCGRALDAGHGVPAPICEGILAALRAVEDVIRVPEWAGPAIAPPVGADVQTQLLSFVGREV